MYLLSITVNMEDGIREELLSWMNLKLTPILANNAIKPREFRVLKIMKEEEGAGSTFSFQYHFPSIAAVDAFEESYDKEIAVNMYRFYKEKFVEFRTRLEKVEWN